MSKSNKPIKQKEKAYSIYIRAPQSYQQDLEKIKKLTGLSINAICLEILRPGIRNWIKELEK
jgi:hypothetical protein